MNHKHAIECVGRTFRDMMPQLQPGGPNYTPDAKDKPFGGKIVIFGGDFRQVLPVIQKASKAQVIAASLKNSYIWRHVHTMPLHLNMRVRKGLQLCPKCMALPFDNLENAICNTCAPMLQKQMEFETFLLKMGDGKLPHPTNNHWDYKVELPSQCLAPAGAEMFHLVTKVFADMPTKWQDAEYMCSRCVLSPLNAHVDKINDFMMERFPSTNQRTYKSIDTVPNDQAMLFTTEFLNDQRDGGMPPHQLTLKTHAPVILLRNLDTSIGLCNGTRLTIVALHKRFVEACIVTGLPMNVGRIVAIPRINFTSDDMPFDMTRYQFPFKPAFALTINKSQGQTLKEVGLYLPDPVFSHGQLYVAFSRVSSLEHIQVLIENTKKQKKLVSLPNQPNATVEPLERQTSTANVVYPEVLWRCGSHQPPKHSITHKL